MLLGDPYRSIARRGVSEGVRAKDFCLLLLLLLSLGWDGFTLRVLVFSGKLWQISRCILSLYMPQEQQRWLGIWCLETFWTVLSYLVSKEESFCKD